MVKFEELEERKNYEISLVKKKNDRLQEQISRLQDKVKNEASPKDNELVRSLRQKNQELQDENALLEEAVEKLKRKFNTSLKRLSKLSSSSMKELFFENIQMVAIEIEKIQSTQYDELLPLIKSQTIRQEEYSEIIETNLKEILRLMEEPFEYLNSLIKKEEKQEQKEFESAGRKI